MTSASEQKVSPMLVVSLSRLNASNQATAVLLLILAGGWLG
jgi:hypothetical protein